MEEVETWSVTWTSRGRVLVDSKVSMRAPRSSTFPKRLFMLATEVDNWERSVWMDVKSTGSLLVEGCDAGWPGIDSSDALLSLMFNLIVWRRLGRVITLRRRSQLQK